MNMRESQYRANRKYDAKAYYSTTVRIKREYEEELKKYAGDSMNAFINQAIMEKIERLKATE